MKLKYSIEFCTYLKLSYRLNFKATNEETVLNKEKETENLKSSLEQQEQNFIESEKKIESLNKRFKQQNDSNDQTLKILESMNDENHELKSKLDSFEVIRTKLAKILFYCVLFKNVKQNEITQLEVFKVNLLIVSFVFYVLFLIKSLKNIAVVELEEKNTTLITRLEQLQTISDEYKSKLDSLNNQIENLQSKNTELEVLLKNYLTQIF